MKRRSPLTAAGWTALALLAVALVVGLYTVAVAWGYAPAPPGPPLGPWAR